MNKLLNRRNTFAKRIQTHYAEFQGKAVEYQTLINAENRLLRLEEDWSSFMAVDKDIQDADEEEETPSYNDDSFYRTQDAYDDNRSMYLNFIKLKTPKAEQLPPPPTFPVNQSNQIDLNSLVRSLPRIEIPKFTGVAKDWPNFRDMYTSLIHSGQSSNAVKFTYLRSYLVGEPLEITKAWSITDDNYTLAWEALKSYYENERRLVHNHLDDMFNVPNMKSESYSEVRRILNEVTAPVEALRLLGRPTEEWNDIVVYILASKMDPKTRREWEKHLGKSKETPGVLRIKTFLETQAQMLESIERAIKSHKPASAPAQPSSLKSPLKKAAQPWLSKPSSVAATTVQSTEAVSSSPVSSCPCCSQQHLIYRCDNFKNKSVPERKKIAIAKRLCFNCLGPHNMQVCTSSSTCKNCDGKHHTLLHFDRTPQSARSQTNDQLPNNVVGTAPANQPTSGPISTSCTTMQMSTGSDDQYTVSSGIFLSSAMIFVSAPGRERVLVRALIDQCSQSSFLSEALARRLGLKGKGVNIPITSVGGQKVMTCSKRTTFSIAPHFKSQFKYEVDALIISKVSTYAPPRSTIDSGLNHLRDLELADPEFYVDYPVEVLLGADVHADILLDKIVRGSPSEPIATYTKLGWVVSGRSSTSDDIADSNGSSATHCTSFNICSDLNSQIHRFWHQEEPPQTRIRSLEDEACEDFFLRTTERENSGHYKVRLPINPEKLSSVQNLGDSYHKAVQMLYRLERKFVSQPLFEQAYKEFMQEYISSNHMTRMSPESANFKPIEQTYFLPHHGVLKPLSTSTKLRTVFNGSSETTSGISLNDLLFKGENLLPELPDLIMNWRVYRYVFVTDIRQMFRQIRVHDEDAHLQAVVWRFSVDDPVDIYYLNTVTYGLVSSPWQAARTLRLLADDNIETFPLAHPIIHSECYMDDMISGAHTIPDTLEKKRQLIELLKASGMELRKWISNHPDILKQLPSEHLAANPDIIFLSSSSFAVLGLHWHAENDSFSFNVSKTELPSKLSKRVVLSLIAQIFDPMGWMSPVIVTAKIFMQTLWLLNCGWDDELPSETSSQWRSWYDKLQVLRDLRIPRHIEWSPEVTCCEIHGFADASQRAFAAVIYLRLVIGVRVFVILQIAKTRVAPLQTQSIPRLELCAAQLLSQLVSHFSRTIRMKIHSTHLWSDSKDVLYWLRSYPARWQIYVANRCRDIQALTSGAHWHYVPTKDNPADVASRGLLPELLQLCDLWWHGPEWLSKSTSSWSTEVDDLGSQKPLEVRKANDSMITSLQCSQNMDCGLWKLAHKFSSLRKLLRITAYVFRFLDKLFSRIKIKSNKFHSIDLSVFGLKFIEPEIKFTSSIVTPIELKNSRLYWVYFFQRSHFSKEIEILRKSQGQPCVKGPLAKLNPFLLDNLLRVGGRLEHALIDYDQKHPLILPGNCAFADLLIDDTHNQTLHGGIQLTLGTIRRQYWLLNGRVFVRLFIHKCVKCRKFSAQQYSQLMGQLPSARTTPTFPFHKTGIDYAGPIQVRLTKTRGKGTLKGYICLFVCLVTRAVHLEAVEDYTSESFLAAFHRFTSRRGWCSEIFSDNAKNFVGADEELRRMFSDSSEFFRDICTFLASHDTQWHWNPPAAPHFGGIWEAGVKSTKYHLKRVVGNDILTFSELSTLLCRIEACLNSRPLLPLTDDPSESEFLSPAHFLILRPSFMLPEKDYTNDNIAIGQRWKLISQRVQAFWERWKYEYLPTLLPRQKWLAKKRSFQLGDVVYIRKENTSPCQWPLGKVTEVNPDRQGISRYFTIRTADSVYIRPGVKLVLVVPVDEAVKQDD